MSQYHESPVDRAIREAQSRGAFDDLPGAGKPLNLGSPADPDWWIKGLIQREQLDMTGALPPGVAFRREIERLPETLSDVHTEAAVREIVEDLNRRILEDRRRPSTGPQVFAPTVEVVEVVARWRAARADRFGPPATAEPMQDTGSTDAQSSRRGFLRRLMRRG